MKLLVSGVGKRNSLIKLIKTTGKNYGIEIVGADSHSFPPAKMEFDSFHNLMAASNEFFLESYINTVEMGGVDVGITLIDPEIPLIGKINNLGGVRIFHPEVYVSLLCEDKYEFSRSAFNAGIKTIHTSIKPFKVFPLVSKDRYGSAASGFKIYRDAVELTNSKITTDLVFQRYCSGRHYCVDAYVSYYTSELIDLCVKEVVNKNRGESFVLRSVNSIEIFEFIKKICSWLPLKGIVNFDVYEGEGEGDLKLMEINCRIGGNYPASHLFGCDLLSHMFYEVTNRSAVKPKYSRYKSNMFVAKYFEFSSPTQVFNWG